MEFKFNGCITYKNLDDHIKKIKESKPVKLVISILVKKTLIMIPKILDINNFTELELRLKIDLCEISNETDDILNILLEHKFTSLVVHISNFSHQKLLEFSRKLNPENLCLNFSNYDASLIHFPINKIVDLEFSEFTLIEFKEYNYKIPKTKSLKLCYVRNLPTNYLDFTYENFKIKESEGCVVDLKNLRVKKHLLLELSIDNIGEHVNNFKIFLNQNKIENISIEFFGIRDLKKSVEDNMKRFLHLFPIEINLNIKIGVYSFKKSGIPKLISDFTENKKNIKEVSEILIKCDYYQYIDAFVLDRICKYYCHTKNFIDINSEDFLPSNIEELRLVKNKISDKPARKGNGLYNLKEIKTISRNMDIFSRSKKQMVKNLLELCE